MEASPAPYAVFSTSFLPYSQTFIYEEVRSHTRYCPEVFCKDRLNRDVFPYDEARIHRPEPPLGPWLYEQVGYWHPFNRLFEQRDFALIHAHFGTGAVYALPYARRHRLPLVVSFYGNDISALLGTQRYQFRRWRYVLRAPAVFRQADLMLVPSVEAGELLGELSGRPDAIRLQHLGIDLERFRHRAGRREEPRVLMIGRFTEKKGMPYGVRAFAEAVRQGRKARLTLVGGGEQEPLLRRLVAEHQLQEHVTFAGVLGPEQVADLLAESDVLMVPSVVARDHDRETGPVVVREASACEVPVIGTCHGGIPAAIDDGVTGFIVPERDVSALADRLITLLDDPALRRQMGRAGRAKMEREFDLRQHVAALERHFDTVRR